MADLPKDLRRMVMELRENAGDSRCPRHEADLYTAIADCIEASKPIPADLQEQYVKMLANQNGQDRYGK